MVDIFCGECHERLRCLKNEVLIQTGSYYRSGDKYGCPDCGGPGVIGTCGSPWEEMDCRGCGARLRWSVGDRPRCKCGAYT